MRSRLIGAATAAACILLSLTVPSAGRAADQTPFAINVIVGLTGSAAFQGQGMAKGLALAEALINRQGGIAGRPVKFVMNDDQNNPQVSVQLMTRLAAEKAAVVIGPGLASTCGATAGIVAASGPVSYCLSPGLSPEPGGFAFVSGPRVEDNFLALVRYMRARGWTRLAVLSTTDASGQSYEKGLTYALSVPENRDVRLVSTEHMNPADISAAAQVVRIKAADPQAILTLATGAPWGTMMRGISESGLSVPIAGGYGNASYAVLSQFRSFLPAEVYFTSLISLVPNPDIRGSLRDRQNQYFAALKDAGARSENSVIQAWDPAWLVVDAFRKLGTDATAAQIRDYLDSLSGWVGIDGTYDFRQIPQRGIGEGAVIVDRWDTAKGEFTPLGRPGGYLR